MVARNFHWSAQQTPRIPFVVWKRVSFDFTAVTFIFSLHSGIARETAGMLTEVFKTRLIKSITSEQFFHASANDESCHLYSLWYLCFFCRYFKSAENYDGNLGFLWRSNKINLFAASWTVVSNWAQASTSVSLKGEPQSAIQTAVQSQIPPVHMWISGEVSDMRQWQKEREGKWRVILICLYQCVTHFRHKL